MPNNDDEANAHEENNGKEYVQREDNVPVVKAAPQAREGEYATQTSVGSETEFEDCKLTPVDYENQRKNIKDVLVGKPPAIPQTPLESNGDHTVQLSGERNDIHQSALHQDEYSQYNDRKGYNPRNHESALDTSPRDGSANGKQSRFARRKKSRLVESRGKSHGRHSHPRKSPYRSEVARLRHAQRDPSDDGSNTTASGKSISLKDTMAPPDTASFAIQSSKFKHSLLHSLGEFLTSAFSDNEESSGSYFSQDLLDQISSSDPNLRGVWLQAKSLNDEHIKQLSEALIRNKNIAEVWLPSNHITDEGAGHIAHMLKFNKSIKELFLGSNDIGPKGAAALASAIARGNTTLVALGLGDNHIGVEGAGAFAAALRHNHCLHTLDVKNNGIPKRSSIRSLLNKMLEFNASDPGDESLVLGLQEELASLVQSLPPEHAERVVLQAEEALKAAMLCRKRGDKIGAAEAEGVFIRICTTGEPPVDPPEETRAGVGRGAGRKKWGGGRGGRKKPMDPEQSVEGLNAELSTLKFGERSEGGPPAIQEEVDDNVSGGEGQGGEPEEEGSNIVGAESKVASEANVINKEEGDKKITDGDTTEDAPEELAADSEEKDGDTTDKEKDEEK